MLPLRIQNATRVLAESQDEYYALAILDEVIDGLPVMSSLREPTPKELQQLLEGGRVRLQIGGFVHPPVNVLVEPLPEEDETP
jgi:hypothetical protein